MADTIAAPQWKATSPMLPGDPDVGTFHLLGSRDDPTTTTAVEGGSIPYFIPLVNYTGDPEDISTLTTWATANSVPPGSHIYYQSVDTWDKFTWYWDGVTIRQVHRQYVGVQTEAELTAAVAAGEKFIVVLGVITLTADVVALDTSFIFPPGSGFDITALGFAWNWYHDHSFKTTPQTTVTPQQMRQVALGHSRDDTEVYTVQLGQVEAGPYQIFFDTSTATTNDQPTPAKVFIKNNVQVEWFGPPKNDPNEDCWNAVQAAAYSTLCEVHFADAAYYLSKPIDGMARQLIGPNTGNMALVPMEGTDWFTEGHTFSQTFTLHDSAVVTGSAYGGVNYPAEARYFPEGKSPMIWVGHHGHDTAATNPGGYPGSGPGETFGWPDDGLSYNLSYHSRVENMRLAIGSLPGVSGIMAQGATGEHTLIRRVSITNYDGYGIAIPETTQNLRIEDAWVSNAWDNEVDVTAYENPGLGYFTVEGTNQLPDNMAVEVSGTLPVAFSTGRLYFWNRVDEDTGFLSATRGGAAIPYVDPGGAITMVITSHQDQIGCRVGSRQYNRGTVIKDSTFLGSFGVVICGENTKIENCHIEVTRKNQIDDSIVGIQAGVYGSNNIRFTSCMIENCGTNGGTDNIAIKRIETAGFAPSISVKGFKQVTGSECEFLIVDEHLGLSLGGSFPWLLQYEHSSEQGRDYDLKTSEPRLGPLERILVYRNYTDGSNWERGRLYLDANDLGLAAEDMGTGTPRNIRLTPGADLILDNAAASDTYFPNLRRNAGVYAGPAGVLYCDTADGNRVKLV